MQVFRFQPTALLYSQSPGFRLVPTLSWVLPLAAWASITWLLSWYIHNAPCLPSDVRLPSFLISTEHLLTPSHHHCPIRCHSDLSIVTHNWEFRRADLTLSRLNVKFLKFRWIWNPCRCIFLLPFPAVYTVHWLALAFCNIT